MAILLYCDLNISICNLTQVQYSNTFNMAKDINTSAHILIIAGPSGSGKNSIMEGVLKQCNKCARLTTATTRAPRATEQHGIDYYFITKSEFLDGIKSGQIPEHWHAEDTDRYYGAYLPDLEKKTAEGKIIIAQVQAEGIKYYKEHFANTLAILVTAGNDDELKRRITSRHPISESEFAERIQLVQQELAEFKPICDYTVRNPDGKLDEAIAEVMQILQKEEYINPHFAKASKGTVKK